MKLDLDRLITKLKISGLDLSDGGTAMYHVYSGLVWSLFWGHFCRLSLWFYFSALLWIGLILVRELVIERAQTLVKTRTDIVTKLAGLVGYVVTFI